MKRSFVIQNNKKERVIAILQKRHLSEIYFHCIDANTTNTMIGDIFVGIIKNTDDNIKAAFINIGSVKDAFLQYYDLGLQFKCLLKFKNFNYLSDVFSHLEEFLITEKNPNINTKILVQLTKKSISNKCPKLTTEMTLSGKYLILLPFGNKIFFSQKIKDYKKRKRLILFFKTIQPSYFGIIVRRVALNQKDEVLMADLIYLKKKWRSLFTKFKSKIYPSRLMRNLDPAFYLLRNLYNVTSIICDNQDLCEVMSVYFSTFQQNKFDIIKYYSDEIVPIFEKYGIEKYIKMNIGNNISLIDGAYLVIDHTEALHVIDVNSGTVEEKNKLEINLIAATEIYRQIKLRDLGGIIVIDFIDMLELDHSKELYSHFSEVMRDDTAKYKILPPNKFGLLQITRERVRHEFSFQSSEKNPNNYKYKKVESPIEHIYRIETILQIGGNCILHTHPFLAAYIKKGFPSLQQRWFFKFKKWIKIYPRYSFSYLEYKILDKKNNIIFFYKN